MDSGLVSIGRIGAPKGVRGDLKVHSYSGESAHFRALKVALLRAPEGLAATAGGAPARAAKALNLKIVRVEGEASSLTIAFEGYASPEAARALTGMEILVPRSAASPLGPNQWYIDDLVGLALVDAKGAALATVDAVLDGAAEPWLEVAVKGRRAIIPFRKEFVGEVDLKAGTIELLVPELLDE